MQEQNKEIVFQYSRADSYGVVSANGVHGGVTSRGDFRFDLFVESPMTPEVVAHSITPDGLGPEIRREPESLPVMREAQVGVVMQLDQAKAFAQWMLNRIHAAEEARNRRGNQGTS